MSTCAGAISNSRVSRASPPSTAKKWRLLGGGRAAPYQCTIGDRTLRIDAERTFFDAQVSMPRFRCPGGIGLESSAGRRTICSLSGRSMFVKNPLWTPDWRQAMSICVRPPKAEDRPAWLTLFKGYIDFYEAAVPDDVIDRSEERRVGKECR